MKEIQPSFEVICGAQQEFPEGIFHEPLKGYDDLISDLRN